MSTDTKITATFQKAISLSDTLKEAEFATSQALSTQQSDQTDAVRAWDDLYEVLVAFTQTDEAAHQSKLGQALEKTI